MEQLKIKNSSDYIPLACRTESSIRCDVPTRLDHASDGCCTEAGEFKDALKQFKFYNTAVDIANVKEELGDMLWYIAIACDALDITMEELMRMNVEKLKVRYPEKFTTKNALNRNLKEERKTLE